MPVVSAKQTFAQENTNFEAHEQRSPQNCKDMDQKSFEPPNMFFESGDSLQERFKLRDITILTPQQVSVFSGNENLP